MTDRLEHAKKAFNENLKLCADSQGNPTDRERYNLYIGLIDLTAGIAEVRALIYDQLDEIRVEMNKIKAALKKGD